MGQGDIFQFLKENEGQIFTSTEINIALDMSSAMDLLLKLRKYPPEGFNSSKENLILDKKIHDKTWTYKRKTYVYWYKYRS